MTPEERQELISKYQAGYDEVVRSLEGFKEEDLTAHPIPGKWSASEIVHHLADSETISGIRLRHLLVEDSPTIYGYDQEMFAVRLGYNHREIGPALEAFRAARANTAQLFARMNEDDWQRAGQHTESGRYSVEDWLAIYAAHAHNHASQIRRLKEAINNQ
ncbi:MAG TPA: DinB family protein [Pyrinomonadaceae bacterium]|jgi:hypothetical protein